MIIKIHINPIITEFIIITIFILLSGYMLKKYHEKNARAKKEPKYSKRTNQSQGICLRTKIGKVSVAINLSKIPTNINEKNKALMFFG